MKPEQLFELMGTVSDEHIKKTADRRGRRNLMRKQIFAGISVAASAVLVVGAVLMGGALNGGTEPPEVLPTEVTETTDVPNTSASTEPPVTETEEITEPNTSDPVTSDSGSTIEYPIGGTHGCKIHPEEYHCIPYSVGVYVGQEKTDAWCQERWAKAEYLNYTDEECRTPSFTIKIFIDEFNVPREVLEKEYENTEWCVHNFDLLYSDDLEAIDAYYSDIEARRLTHYRQNYAHSLKWYFIQKLDLPYDTNEIGLVELIRNYNISKYDVTLAMRNYYDECMTWKYPEIRKIVESFTIKYDEAVSGELPIFDENGERLSFQEQDAAFFGVDNWYTD